MAHQVDTLEGLVAAFAEAQEGRKPALGTYNPVRFDGEGIYCPTCGNSRRVTVAVLVPDVGLFRMQLGQNKTPAQAVTPSLSLLTCKQCDTKLTAVIFAGPTGSELVIFPSVLGGLSTPHTPPGVGYYLDQAQRAQSAGARSAAMAMYRAALEHVLHEQGYEKKMLGPKIGELTKAIEDGSAPPWTAHLEAAYLEVIGKLGNAAIHPTKDGSISPQVHVDDALLEAVTVTFAELLQIVYEREHESASRLAALQGALERVQSAGEPAE